MSPHINVQNLKKQMSEQTKYKKVITNTSNRHFDVNKIINKDKQRRYQLDLKRKYLRQSKLPPLPENYYGSQIDEVSSVRDSIIENESQINTRHKAELAKLGSQSPKRKPSLSAIKKLSQPKGLVIGSVKHSQGELQAKSELSHKLPKERRSTNKQPTKAFDLAANTSGK